MSDWLTALGALGVVTEQESSSDSATGKQGSPQSAGSGKHAAQPEQPSKKSRAGVVFSTNPDYEYTSEGESEAESLPKNQQKLRVSMERAGRGGKTVTLVRGFIGSDDDLEALGKLLKQKCGVGGSVKDGEIIIQGDHRPRLVEILKKEGYTQTKG